MNLYMHTIAGKPAMYEDSQQIVYFNSYHTVKFSEVFVDSLDKIRQQQEKSNAWRKQQGYGDNTPSKYGYIRIKDDRAVIDLQSLDQEAKSRPSEAQPPSLLEYRKTK